MGGKKHFRGERIVKSRPSWRNSDQVNKLRFSMVLTAIVMLFLAAMGGMFAWMQMNHAFDNKTKTDSEVQQANLNMNDDENSLPIYDNDFNLLLINNVTPIQENIKPQLAVYNGIQMDSRIVSSLKKMLGDAKKDGINIIVTGGYIDIAKQNKMFQAEVEALMKSKGFSRVKAENDAQSLVPRGGYSEYQSGLAVDLAAASSTANTDFSTSNEYSWLLRNSVNYGFVLRIPKNKTATVGMNFNPNHFRYVGVENAKKMRTLEMCLEEYHQYVQNQE